jgi:hypothetical protein
MTGVENSAKAHSSPPPAKVVIFGSFSSSIPEFVDPDSSRAECTGSRNHHFPVLPREKVVISAQVGWERGEKTPPYYIVELPF